jgi:hypothetical protein
MLSGGRSLLKISAETDEISQVGQIAAITQAQGMLPGRLDGGDPRSASRFLFQTMMVKVL